MTPLRKYLQNQPEYLRGIYARVPIGVLHTWTQTLLDHFHLHCLVPGGVLASDKSAWTSSKTNFLFRTDSLMLAFKNVYIKGLKELKDSGKLIFSGNTAKYGNDSEFHRLINKIAKKKWCGYAKAPFSGPEKVLEYLGRYTHRVAISNYRIQSMENGKVIFSWKDRSDDNKTKFMTLDGEEFMPCLIKQLIFRSSFYNTYNIILAFF